MHKYHRTFQQIVWWDIGRLMVMQMMKAGMGLHGTGTPIYTSNRNSATNSAILLPSTSAIQLPSSGLSICIQRTLFPSVFG